MIHTPSIPRDQIENYCLQAVEQIKKDQNLVDLPPSVTNFVILFVVAGMLCDKLDIRDAQKKKDIQSKFILRLRSCGLQAAPWTAQSIDQIQLHQDMISKSFLGVIVCVSPGAMIKIVSLIQTVNEPT